MPPKGRPVTDPVTKLAMEMHNDTWSRMSQSQKKSARKKAARILSQEEEQMRRELAKIQTPDYDKLSKELALSTAPSSIPKLEQDTPDSVSMPIRNLDSEFKKSIESKSTESKTQVKEEKLIKELENILEKDTSQKTINFDDLQNVLKKFLKPLPPKKPKKFKVSFGNPKKRKRTLLKYV